MAIRSFRDPRAATLFGGERVAELQAMEKVVLRKLEVLNAAVRLSDIAAVPGNRLEALKGKRRGQHSIRINDQFRICFVWRDGDVHELEIVDYH